MLAHGRGRILNVASTAAFQPTPYQAVYGAAKAFVLSFSRALAEELRGSGVTVTALCPGPTRTGFIDALGSDVSDTAIYRRLADPGPVVDAGLRAMDRGRPAVVPGLRNRVQTIAVRFTPTGLVTRLSARLLASGAPRGAGKIDAAKIDAGKTDAATTGAATTPGAR
jgi:short-subunit dehydrogenase